MDIKILEKIIRILAYILIIDFILMVGYANFGVFTVDFKVFLVLSIILAVCIPLILVLGLVRYLLALKIVPSQINNLEEIGDKATEELETNFRALTECKKLHEYGSQKKKEENNG